MAAAAVMPAVPGATPVTTPLLEMAATDDAEVDHLIAVLVVPLTDAAIDCVPPHGNRCRPERNRNTDRGAALATLLRGVLGVSSSHAVATARTSKPIDLADLRRQADAGREMRIGDAWSLNAEAD